MYTRDQGVQAIIDLQKMAGVTETVENAQQGWDAMKPGERESTEEVHRLFCAESVVEDA